MVEWVEVRVGPHLWGLGRPHVLVCVRGVEEGFVAEVFVVLRKGLDATFDLTFMEVAVGRPADIYAEAGVVFDAQFVTDRVTVTVKEYLQHEHSKAAAEGQNGWAQPEWEFERLEWRKALCLLKLDGVPPHLLQAIRQTTRSEQVGQFIEALRAAPQPFAFVHEPTRRSFREVWKKPLDSRTGPNLPESPTK
jgi:hypothetical protein